jgi:hypothetical protein
MLGGLPPVKLSVTVVASHQSAGEIGMNAKAHEQAAAKVQAMAAKLNDEALCLAWMATEGKPVTEELALVRGWIMDVLNERLGDDLFDEWLTAIDDNGNGLNTLAYFERKGN